MIRLNIKRIVTAALLLVLTILVVFVLSGCKKSVSETANVSATMAPDVSEPLITETPVDEMSEIEVPVAAEKEDIQIETPYCTLYYPGEWEPFLQVEQTAGELYKATFRACLDTGREQDLFLIVFGGDAVSAYGSIMSEQGETVPVSIVCDDIAVDESWTENEIYIVFAMQEALNDVLARLPLIEGEESRSQEYPDVEVLPTDNGEEVSTGTEEHIELVFPARWEEYLITKVNEDDIYNVGYYASVGEHEEILLFTIYFGGEEGMSVQTITDLNGEDVEIRIDIYDLKFDESWSADEQLIVVAMQEDLNYLLSNLG